MNERILELFNKACVYAYEQNPGENSYGRPVDENKYEEDRYTKFAELIVKDVRWVMQTAADDFILDENYDAVKGVGRCMRRVKQHFGVEE